MCGIFGTWGVESTPSLARHAKTLAHRGPDGFGEHFDNEHRLYLAHCRLAIIDLSRDGAQPMRNAEGTLWLTYNGEIFNFLELRKELQSRGYVFRSRTDTEVIIHAYEEWGMQCLDHFNGMFAFALWDAKEHKLFLARDRLGIKPLYYTHVGRQFAFASEPKALIELPFYSKNIDYHGLSSYLINRYVAGSDSIWNGISRLLPGHYLVLDTKSNEVQRVKYWELDTRQQKWNEDEALDKLQELMAASAKRHLISDVPVGLFLSGGMDSTCVAQACAREVVGISTFSMSFEGANNTELPLARETARRLRTNHHEEYLGKGNFPKPSELFDYYDEPLGDTSIFPTYMVSQVARRHAKVALSGDGGDELFGGYEWYTQTENARPLKRIAFMLGPLFKSLGLGNTELGKRTDKFDHYRRMISPAFTITELSELLPGMMQDELPPNETYLYKQHYKKKGGAYRRWQYVDAMTFLVDNNLTKVDRASMAHGLEVRVPLLDHNIVEFAFSLADDLCVRNGQKKYILRRLLEMNGMEHVVDAPKQGFSCSVGRFWDIEIMAQDVLKGELLKNGILSHKAVISIVENRGAFNRDLKIWLLAVLEHWSRRWLFS